MAIARNRYDSLGLKNDTNKLVYIIYAIHIFQQIRGSLPPK